jgi:hypothetical protein
VSPPACWNEFRVYEVEGDREWFKVASLFAAEHGWAHRSASCELRPWRHSCGSGLEGTT